MERWEPDFDFYMAQLEDRPASFVVDLAAAAQAPVASHPLLLSIQVPMLRPRPDGLRDASELDDLGALEDQFVEALAAKVDAVYVGRTVHDGNTTLYLYVPEEHREALDELPALTGAPPGEYEPRWGVADDPEWEQYTEFLAPDDYAHQTIWNRRLVKQFTEMGDELAVAREIDHMTYFPSRQAAEQAAVELAALGFRVDEPTSSEDDEAEDDDEADAEDGDQEGDDDEAEADAVSADGDDEDDDSDSDEDEEGDDDDEASMSADDDDDDDDDSDDEERWGLQFHRDDSLADGRPDEFVAEILDVILPLGGSYDGWGAMHVKADAS